MYHVNDTGCRTTGLGSQVFPMTLCPCKIRSIESASASSSPWLSKRQSRRALRWVHVKGIHQGFWSTKILAGNNRNSTVGVNLYLIQCLRLWTQYNTACRTVYWNGVWWRSKIYRAFVWTQGHCRLIQTIQTTCAYTYWRGVGSLTVNSNSDIFAFPLSFAPTPSHSKYYQ